MRLFGVVLPAILVSACGGPNGPYLDVTIKGLPAQAVSLEATVTLADGRSASQSIDDVTGDVDGQTSLVIGLPADGQVMSLRVAARQDGCTTYSGRTDGPLAPADVVSTTVALTPSSIEDCGCISQLSLRDRTGCAIKRDGRLYCWAWSPAGGIGYSAGDCPTSPGDQCSPTPSVVPGLAAESVAVGDRHTCAINAADGSVWCWGDGFTAMPALVNNTHQYKQVVSGNGFSCVLGVGGRVYCLGKNINAVLGQLPSQLASSPTPVRIAGLGAVVELAAGSHHACARKGDGTVWCWGGDGFGQLGPAAAADTCGGAQNPSPCSPTPLQVTSDAQQTPLLARQLRLSDDDSCVLPQDDSRVLCWGANGSLQLGASGGGVSVPLMVNGTPAAVAELIAGGATACVRTTAGEAWCWGDNGEQQVAQDTAPQFATPMVSPYYQRAVRFGVSATFSCASLPGGMACAGNNDYGQLGDGTFDPGSLPETSVALQCP